MLLTSFGVRCAGHLTYELHYEVLKAHSRVIWIALLEDFNRIYYLLIPY